MWFNTTCAVLQFCFISVVLQTPPTGWSISGVTASYYLIKFFLEDFLINLGAFEYHRSPLVGELFSTCISKTMPNPENTGIKMLNLGFSSLILVYSTVFLEAVLFMQITNMLCFSTNGLHLDVS